MRKKSKSSFCRVDQLELRRLLSGTVIYVSAAATSGADNGTSWANAFVDLQSGLSAAVADSPSSTNPITIEVGQGTYYPTIVGGSRSDTFQLVSDVTLQGGYAGYGTSNPDALSVAEYPTILSGDISTSGNSNNSYHVVTGSGTDSTATLNGFTITGGNGGGLNVGGGLNGGGIYDKNGSPTINDCTISGNIANNGGGIYSEYFIEEPSPNGGEDSSPTLTNCVINGNTAEGSGGGMSNGFHSSATLINCTFSENTAESGGGIASSSATLINCIFWNDIAASGENSEISSGSTVTITYSDIDQSGYAGSNGNIDANPLFVDPADGNFQIQPDSSAVDAGNNAAVPNGITTDLAGNPRFQNVPTSTHSGSGSTPIVDMGAYEATAALAANIGGSYFVLTGQSISLSGYGSSMVAGSLSYGWSVNGDNNFTDLTGTDPTFDTAGYSLGVHDITLRVTDADGNSVEASSTITILPPTIYVDAGATTGANDGLSWSDAFTNLQSALNEAISGMSIDVAGGTYYPTTGTDRAATFQLKNGVGVYGGFAGSADPGNPSLRDPSTYVTTLSGDIDTQSNNSDNSYHVVTASGTDSTAILDGFTVTDGNASASNPMNSRGGGIYDYNGSPTINDCIIGGNRADEDGGGISINSGSPLLTNCTITGNTAIDGGGGISNNDYSSPTLVNCMVSGNTASYGGGMRVNGSLTLTNCIISGNTAESGGGMSNYSSSPIILTNCTISGNTATGTYSGGGMNNYISSPTLINCILWGDMASTSGDDEFNTDSSITISHSDIDQRGYAGVDGNIDSDPMFVRDPGTNGPTDYGDLHLESDSPAIDAGSNTAIPSGITTDLDGNPRIVNSIVDMGAYEFQQSNSSVPGSFTLSNQPLSWNAGPTVLLSWTASSNALSYEVFRDNTEIFPTGSNTLTATQYTDSSSLAPGATYSYYVLAVNSAGSTVSNSVNITMPASGPADKLAIITGPANSITAGTDIPLVIAVEDQEGNVVASDNSSSITVLLDGVALGTTTADAGTAAFSNISITEAATADIFSFTDSTAGVSGISSGSFQITSAGPISLTIIAQPPASGIAGQTLSAVSIQVEDQYGNPVNGSSVSLALGNGAPAGAILGGTLTESTTNGIATFSDLTLNRAGTYTLSASDGSLPSVSSNSFSITYASSQLVFAQQPLTQTAGGKFSLEIDADNTDGSLMSFGKKKPKLKLSISNGGKLVGSTTATMAADGKMIFKNLSIQKIGSYILTATDASDSSLSAGQSDSLLITAAAAKKMVFNPQPAAQQASSPFNVTVELLDQYGNAAGDGSTVDLVLGSHPKNVASLNLSSTASDGFADFDGVTLATAGDYTLKANDGKLKATSKKFLVSA